MSVTFRATGREILELNRLQPLIFGYYAWGDSDEHQRVEEAGSGIFVAPRLGLTAKHVSKSFGKLDSQVAAFERRKTPLDPQYAIHKMKSEFATMIYQAAPPDDLVQWKVHVDWPSYDTDINALQVEPRTPGAVRVERELRYFDWQLLPPRVGKHVRIYGWPKQEIDIVGGEGELQDHIQHVELWTYHARVVEHVAPIKAHGFGEFPGFRLDREFEHGFSGGPVLYDGKLVGIFSGPDYVASLWPLALMTYPDVNDVEHAFAELFDDGTIEALDWDEVKGRVVRKPCQEALAGSHVETRCIRQHVVLNP
jgi:hypothetical protein